MEVDFTSERSMRELAGGDAVDFTSERGGRRRRCYARARIKRMANWWVGAKRLAHGRARARAYFSKLHRKLAQIFSAFFGFWPDSSPESCISA